jgi:hypothetical protein
LSCDHNQNEATCSVMHYPGKPSLVEVRVRCKECGQPYRFLGMERGQSFGVPMASDDDTAAFLPMVNP